MDMASSSSSSSIVYPAPAVVMSILNASLFCNSISTFLFVLCCHVTVLSGVIILLDSMEPKEEMTSLEKMDVDARMIPVSTPLYERMHVDMDNISSSHPTIVYPASAVVMSILNASLFCNSISTFLFALCCHVTVLSGVIILLDSMEPKEEMPSLEKMDVDARMIDRIPVSTPLYERMHVDMDKISSSSSHPTIVSVTTYPTMPAREQKIPALISQKSTIVARKVAVRTQESPICKSSTLELKLAVPAKKPPFPAIMTKKTPVPTRELPISVSSASVLKPLDCANKQRVPVQTSLVCTQKPQVTVQTTPAPTQKPQISARKLRVRTQKPLPTQKPQVATQTLRVPAQKPPFPKHHRSLQVPTQKPGIPAQKLRVADQKPLSSQKPQVSAQKLRVPAQKPQVATKNLRVPAQKTLFSRTSQVATQKPQISARKLRVRTQKPLPAQKPQAATQNLRVPAQKPPFSKHHRSPQVPTQKQGVPAQKLRVADQKPLSSQKPLVSAQKLRVPAQKPQVATQNLRVPAQKPQVATQNLRVPAQKTLSSRTSQVATQKPQVTTQKRRFPPILARKPLVPIVKLPSRVSNTSEVKLPYAKKPHKCVSSTCELKRPVLQWKF